MIAIRAGKYVVQIDLAEMESEMTQVLIEANSVIKHEAHLKISCVGNKNSESGFS